MKNKGFTLIEILFVLAIISFLGIMVSINLTKSLKRAQKKECGDFVNSIEAGACAYYNHLKMSNLTMCNSNGVCFNNISGTQNYEIIINISNIIDNGYLSEKIDPCTNDKTYLNETVVVLDNYNSTVTCTYAEGRNRYAQQ